MKMTTTRHCEEERRSNLLSAGTILDPQEIATSRFFDY
jgi:hypothetical protein